MVILLLVGFLSGNSLGACASEVRKVRHHRVAKKGRSGKATVTSQVVKSDKPLDVTTGDGLCASKVNDLAFTILKKQSETEPYKSFTFSPLSVSYALAMTSNGASGATLKEIEALIGQTAAANSFYSHYMARFAPSVAMSNYLALGKRFPVNPAFVKAIEGGYNAQVGNLDFGTAEATRQLNDWIKQQSGGEFQDIVKQTHVNEVAYLINYMKFKALWQAPFDKNNTWDRDFTCDDGTTTQVPTMFQYFREEYYEDSKCQAVSKKYDNSELRMLIVLPKDMKINKFVASMSVKDFGNIIAGLKTTRADVDLSLPRFETDCSLDMREMLRDLMPTAFDERANFSKLSNEKAYINRFTQDTRITVNEHGTEASGVTVQSFLVKAMHPQFTANHPFLYFIYDTTTHAILQAGQFCGNKS